MPLRVPGKLQLYWEWQFFYNTMRQLQTQFKSLFLSSTVDCTVCNFALLGQPL